MSVGKRIQKRRKALGLTQEGLAKLAGMSPSGIGHIEHEDSTPRKSSTRKINWALRMAEKDIVGVTDGTENTAPSPGEGAYRSVFESLAELHNGVTADEIEQFILGKQRAWDEEQAAKRAKEAAAAVAEKPKKAPASNGSLPKIYNVKQVDDMLCCSTKSVYRLVKDGTIKRLPMGAVRVTATELQRFCSSQ